MAFDGKHKATARLTVQVLDVDDNRPVCVDDYVSMSVSESLPIGHLLHTVNAYNLNGKDRRRLRYELVPAEQIKTSSNSSSFRRVREEGLFFSHRLNAKSVYSSMFPFSINEQTGAIRLVHSFDYEYQKLYSFYARVGQSDDAASNRADSGLSSCFVKFRLEIRDENDNKPEFSAENYVISVRENSLLKDASKLLALDIDSKLNGAVRYSFLNDQHLFGLDPKSGLVTLKTSLDRELLGDWLNLTVRSVR
jgi:protocadherin Fat 1/2/3